jgi:small subunit ribosomal protein S16
MIKIRLRRVGAKGQPHYRVVVADARSPRDGRFIETIGHYNPRLDPPEFKIAEDRAVYWLQRGAQPTDAVLRMFEKLGTLEKLERVKAGESLADILAEVAEAAPVPEEVVAEPPREEAEAAPAPAEAEPVPDIAVEDLDLSTRVVNVLSEAGIETVQDLLTKLEEGREAALAIPGLGEKSLDEIEASLRARDLLE